MTLNAPDNKAWLGRQDQRPIAAFIRRVADIAEMANLDACGLWKYLNLKALTEGQSRDLNAHLRQQNLSTANYGEKLLAAEHWLLTTFELTNSLDNLYQRLDSIPPNSTAEQAQSTLNAVYFDALCMDQDIHESTLKRAFIKALPKYI
ncbi:hypothetical protein FOZ61_000704 [Perkinsus olseni]|uniref:Uncharacterized protein n=1 Tax=Perkinsus olseni TaxID=32597 RepID=A0A7J6KU65_PEROL|nr:hypothetical protein FOZ61_000704 [Perkinsus olseni]KAF4650865.1 hypothetical protein FOL46_000672 [Perkinsus olseni]